jgi:hypothetical protein
MCRICRVGGAFGPGGAEDRSRLSRVSDKVAQNLTALLAASVHGGGVAPVQTWRDLYDQQQEDVVIFLLIGS